MDVFSCSAFSGSHQSNASKTTSLLKKINDDKDVTYFKTKSLAYKNLVTFTDLLCDKIHSSFNTKYNNVYTLKDELFTKCKEFFTKLEKMCDDTDLKIGKGPSSLRFGHVAFRDWFDEMVESCNTFIQDLASDMDDKYKEEMVFYLSESFGNRMRIDYGTGHELNFIIFMMGLSHIEDSNSSGGDTNTKNQKLLLTPDKLKIYVDAHGWDLICLFARYYISLARRLQAKFRLEPAGSRGVYNMDDYQFFPFLLGTSQLCGSQQIQTHDFYLSDQVDKYKDDYIFFDALDFILKNKKGPFNEHSYTLWNFTSLGTWDSIYTRIKAKFRDDVLHPFPIIQHIMFGEHIMSWKST